MKETTKEWLDHAKADLLNCELILHEKLLTNIIAFHAQQAIEKAFKALLEEKDLSIPHVHSLQHLFALTEQFIHKEINITDIALLDSVYTSSRYPADIGLLANGKPTLEEAGEIYKKAKVIFEIIIESIIENDNLSK